MIAMTCILSRRGAFLVLDVDCIQKYIDGLRSVVYPEGDWVLSLEYVYNADCRVYVPHFVLYDAPAVFDAGDVKELAEALSEHGFRVLDFAVSYDDVDLFLVDVFMAPVEWINAYPDCYKEVIKWVSQ